MLLKIPLGPWVFEDRVCHSAGINTSSVAEFGSESILRDCDSFFFSFTLIPPFSCSKSSLVSVPLQSQLAYRVPPSNPASTKVTEYKRLPQPHGALLRERTVPRFDHRTYLADTNRAQLLERPEPCVAYSLVTGTCLSKSPLRSSHFLRRSSI